MTLPPLPEPRDYIRGYGDIYTEAQMLTYRAAVVEACAREAESLNLYGSFDCRTIQNATIKDCADAIRSMK